VLWRERALHFINLNKFHLFFAKLLQFNFPAPRISVSASCRRRNPEGRHAWGPALPGEDEEKKKETREMPTGTVKWFNTTKGYGFIAPDDGGKDVFVHISAVERSGLTGLADNQKVGYDLRDGRDGRQMASDLKLL